MPYVQIIGIRHVMAVIYVYKWTEKSALIIKNLT